MKSGLKRRAWDIAAQWIDAGCDAFDPPVDLTDEEADQVRSYMRSAITKDMRNKGSIGFEPKPRPMGCKCKVPTFNRRRPISAGGECSVCGAGA